MNRITLKKTRMRLKISQFLLSVKSGVSRYRISLFESGYIPQLSGKEIEAIKKALNKLDYKFSGGLDGRV